MKQYSKVQNIETVQPKAKNQALVNTILSGYNNLVQKKKNDSGLPDNLKSGVENLSGYSMDDVKVHYGSSKPAELQAHAYAQGTDIHVAPGQEQHLPHEAWHVVQQKQGRVQPTMQMKGKVNVNDDAGLENEADVMGAKALSENATLQKQSTVINTKDSTPDIAQRVVNVQGETNKTVLWENVKGLVEKVYRRRKTLFEWVSDLSINYNPASYDELAEALDNANRYKPKSGGRVRPEWSPNVVKLFNETWGGKRHRRHIIMSSLMRDAVYAVSDNSEIEDKDKIDVYNEILGLVGFTSDGTLDGAESLLVYVLHNNPANLVLDSGVENSAIGGLAHNINDKLKIDDLTHEFELFESNKAGYLDKLAHGFSQSTQKQIMLTVCANFPLPEDKDQFREFLEMLYDNTAVDILTNEKLPKQAPDLINLHMGFVNSQFTGNLKVLLQTCLKYIEIGNQSKPYSYQDVLK